MATNTNLIAQLRAAARSLDLATVSARTMPELADLASRVRAVLEMIEHPMPGPGQCVFGWGICPEHGQSLATDGTISWCTACGREWDYDRLESPCTEPATHRMGPGLICTGHAISAPAGARVEPLTGDEGGRA